MEYNNKRPLVYSLIVVLLLITGITVAWLTWRSGNTNIGISTGCFTINYSKGQDISGASLKLLNENNIISNNNITITEGMAITTASIGINSTCNIEGYGILKLNVNSLSPAFTTGNSKGALKYAVVSYNPSTYPNVTVANLNNTSFTILSTGTIESTGTIDIHTEMLSNTAINNYIIIIYIDGSKAGNDIVGSSFSGTISAEANQGDIPIASNIIRNLYNPNGNTKPTVNNVTYNLDTTNRLMEDVVGNIRYYGSDDPDVPDDLKNYIYFNCAEYPSTNCELWRIIGVFGDKVKIMRNSPLDIVLSWDTSASTVNTGYGINEWSQADLMKLLNPGYTGNQDLDSSGNTITVNNSLYWTGVQATSSGTCYNGQSNATTTCDFRSTGLKNDKTRDLISEHTWSLRGVSSNSTYVDAAYNQEISTGTVIQNPSDGITRTTSWPGRIALAYASDYGYAADLSLCEMLLSSYGNSTCTSNNWMFNSSYQWLLAPYSLTADYVWYVYSDGSLYNYYAYFASSVRPVLYLNSDVSLGGGTGASNDPYTLAVN